MELAVEKIGHIIVKAREYDAKVAPWDDDGELLDGSVESAAVLETRRTDMTRSETAQFIAALNDDEQAELVALIWVGRGTYEPEDWDEAVETARAERVTDTVRREEVTVNDDVIDTTEFDDEGRRRI